MNIYGKLKAISPIRLLLVTIIVVLISSLSDRYLISQLDDNMNSMYVDRLVPAVELFHLNYEIFEKRLAAERYLVKPSRDLKEEYYQALLFTDRMIDSLITSYETTYLVPEESDHLFKLKRSINQARALEREFVMGGRQQDQILVRYLFPIYEDIRLELLDLVDIQKKVGDELRSGSGKAGWTMNQLNHLQVAFAVILALLLYQLLFSIAPKNKNELDNFSNN